MGPGLHAHVPCCRAMHLPSPVLHHLHFDIFGVSLDFVHRCHKLEANAVALIHREDLHRESRAKQGWAGWGARPVEGDGHDTHVQHSLCCVHWWLPVLSLHCHPVLPLQ